MDRIDSGDILLEGRALRVRSPREAVRAGIALVTEDRQITGLATKLSVAFNMTLANTDGISRWGVLNLDKQTRVTSDYQQRLRIRMSGPKQLAGRTERRQSAKGRHRKMAVSWSAGIFI